LAVVAFLSFGIERKNALNSRAAGVASLAHCCLPMSAWEAMAAEEEMTWIFTV
jgi:hypothetical protein